MRIRRAKSSDINQIYTLGKDEFKKEKWFNRRIIRRLMAFNPDLCWVLEDKGQIIGARIFIESMGSSVWGWLIIIRKDLRHHHLGTMFFERTCAELKKMGYKRILTDVEHDNTASIKWHRKVGYKPIGYAKDWFDDGVDAIIFKKEL